MKKIIFFIFGFLLAIATFIGWNLFGPTVNAPKNKYLYIPTGSDYTFLKKALADSGITTSRFFDIVAKKKDLPTHVRAGRYEIKEGMSIVKLVNMFRAGLQSPMRLTINKLRTKEDLAAKLGKTFEFDSLTAIKYLNNPDSLKKLGVDTNSLMTLVIPETYNLNWNTPMPKVMERLKKEQDNFWNTDRNAKAKALGFSEKQIYIIASIVEEETNKQDEKGKVASVYINRLRKGMKLQADPTVKFAMKDFALTRILFKHLSYPSPFNTYYAAGLPPGPICTPSAPTIDAVLDAPETDYIFFVASPKFNGYHVFASNYEQHKILAREYQMALDSLIIAKRKKEAANTP